MESIEEEEIETGMEDEVFEGEEVDFDYEFDAPQIFDFTLPETGCESIQAELWFETAEDYPPSPFVVKLRWLKYMLMRKLKSRESHKDRLRIVNDDTDVDDDDDCIISVDSDISYHGDNRTGLTVHHSQVKSGFRSSTLMKPTASHLAKQSKHRETNERFRRHEKCFQNYALDNHTMKRQKLNSGYLCKGAYLKQKTSFPHKTTKEVYMSDVNKLRVTIPKGAYLQTALRAQRHMLRVTSKTDEHAGHIFKARPLNRKILEAPSLSFPKKSLPQLPKFNEFFLKTSERAMQHK